jgi:Ca-activated chloride channel family protein
MNKGRINIKSVFSMLALIAVSFSAYSQSSKKLIHDGNKLYEEKKYKEAEENYRKSLSDKNNAFIGNYNLGNALYQEGKLDEARDQYQTATANKSASPKQLAQAYHNLGNAYLKNKKYEESVQSYKQSLKLNPQDNDTRYNLAYAQSMLQQQQKQQQQNKDNQDKKDQKKDQQKQDQQQQQKQDQKKDEQNQAQQQKPKDKISKEDADKILQALNNDEKKTQKKMNVKQPVKVEIDKQW